MAILEPYIRTISHDGRYVWIAKGRLAKELQREYGDLFIQGREERLHTIELKAEQENKWGNVFLEEWSNRSRFKRGWMDSLNVDFLLYHFIDSDELLVFDFQELKKWAYCCEKGGRPALYQYPMKPQDSREQLNDTWGVCVPIASIPRNVLLKTIKPSDFSLEKRAA